MSIILLDGSLKVEISFEKSELRFDDNIRVTFVEDCPDDERLFRAVETNIFLTPDQACELARRLIHDSPVQPSGLIRYQLSAGGELMMEQFDISTLLPASPKEVFRAWLDGTPGCGIYRQPGGGG